MPSPGAINCAPFDGITAANDLGLTDAVPARVTIHTDARRRSIQLDKLLIDFKQTAPSRLYWAGRPAMRVVQALHWLKDTLPGDSDRIRQRLHNVLTDPKQRAAIINDLIEGFSNMPIWMQEFLRTLPGFDPRVDNADIPRPSKSLEGTPTSALKNHPERISMNNAFREVIEARERDRRDLFVAAATRLGTAAEKGSDHPGRQGRLRV